LARKPEGEYLLENLGLNGRIISKWIIMKYGRRVHLVQDKDQSWLL
jgi:hypothetical protein